MMNAFLMPIIAVIAIIIGVVIIVPIWLIRTHLKLKRDYQTLATIVYGHDNDIADLCAAALVVDGYRAATDEQLSALNQKISDYQQKNESASHPYSQDIQKVRGGASVSELMQKSGLSQDEAALLIRLHGSKG